MLHNIYQRWCITMCYYVLGYDANEKQNENNIKTCANHVKGQAARNARDALVRKRCV